MHKAAAAATPAETEAEEPPATEEQAIPAWYRLFGDALLGIVAMVGASLWMALSSDLNDLSKEIGQLRDQQSLYMLKGPFIEQDEALASQVAAARKAVENTLARWQESDDRFDEDLLRFQSDLRKHDRDMERELSALRERLAPLEREAGETGP